MARSRFHPESCRSPALEVSRFHKRCSISAQFPIRGLLTATLVLTAAGAFAAEPGKSAVGAPLERGRGKVQASDAVKHAPETDKPQPTPPPARTVVERKPIDGVVEAAPLPLPSSPAEKSIVKLVLVFSQDEARRAVSAVLIKGSGKSHFVVIAGPASIVPDGVGHAIDRMYLEIDDQAPIEAEYVRTGTVEFQLHRIVGELPMPRPTGIRTGRWNASRPGLRTIGPRSPLDNRSPP